MRLHTMLQVETSSTQVQTVFPAGCPRCMCRWCLQLGAQDGDCCSVSYGHFNFTKSARLLSRLVECVSSLINRAWMPVSSSPHPHPCPWHTGFCQWAWNEISLFSFPFYLWPWASFESLLARPLLWVASFCSLPFAPGFLVFFLWICTSSFYILNTNGLVIIGVVGTLWSLHLICVVLISFKCCKT